MRTAKHYEQLCAKVEALRVRSIPDNVVRLKAGAKHVCNKDGPRVEVAMDVETCSVCGFRRFSIRPG
jgi:hypothetical protein